MQKIQSALPPEKYGKRTYSVQSRMKKDSALTASEGGITKERDAKPFDSMNNIVANLLLNMTR